MSYAYFLHFVSVITLNVYDYIKLKRQRLKNDVAKANFGQVKNESDHTAQFTKGFHHPLLDPW